MAHLRSIGCVINNTANVVATGEIIDPQSSASGRYHLDGSKRAEMIRPHERELASRFQATVILIMVIEHIYADGIGQTYVRASVRKLSTRN